MDRCSWWPVGAVAWGIDEKATALPRVPGRPERRRERNGTTPEPQERPFGGTVRGMPRAMTEDEWRRFVMEGTHTGKLATVRKDGSPSVVPIWFVLDDEGAFVFTTGSRSGKARAMRRDPRVALVVDEERPPFSFVLVRGEVTLDDDVEAMLPWATKIGGRYMGQDQAEQLGRRNAVPGEVLVRLVPQVVIAQADLAD